MLTYAHLKLSDAESGIQQTALFSHSYTFEYTATYQLS